VLTRPKDLSTGAPVWRAYGTPAIPATKLNADAKADVVVIGAGVSGAMVAEELADAGFSVLILDRRDKALSGSTSASTALLQYELDTPLTVMAKQIGFDDAARAWRRSKLGLESLAAKTQMLGIACGQVRRNSLQLTGDVLDADGLREEQALRGSIGLHTEYLTTKQLKERYGIRRQAALNVANAIAVNPLKLAAGYLRNALRKGAKLYAPVTVEDLRPHRSGVDIIADNGVSIRAKHVIFACGYELPKGVSMKDHKITSTWAIATRPQRERLWPGQALIWEASQPYLYIRTASDGRVICGGEDEEFSDEEQRDALIPEKTRILSSKLEKLLPGLDVTPDYAWTGCFGGTGDDLPSIGPIPKMANCYGVLAFGGNGITFSRIAAEVIRSTLSGKDDPEADLFAFR
jgi:glycine/D-amino acid oxidase-like deaminating enzyme